MSPEETVRNFINCINQRDADNLADMMTEDHVFIDSLGQTVQGRERMRAGWRGYYIFCPDYRISYDKILSDRNVVAVFGTAGGTVAENGKLPAANQWSTPAAWMAVVENNLVKEWRVYADNKPVHDIIAKSKNAPL